MTPAEQRGLKIGSKIVFTGQGDVSQLNIHEVFTIGEVLTLILDDGTMIPRFSGERGKDYYFDLDRDWEHYKEKIKMTHFLENTKINVQKHADKWGVDLAEANRRIQTELFKHGATRTYNISAILFKPAFIYVHKGRDNNLYLQRDDSESLFVNDEYKEIEFHETISYEIKVVEVEYIELNGKRYRKDKLEQALASIEESTT